MGGMRGSGTGGMPTGLTPGGNAGAAGPVPGAGSIVTFGGGSVAAGSGIDGGASMFGGGNSALAGRTPSGPATTGVVIR